MFRYRLHTPDGGDVGEATYAQMIRPGEEIFFGGGRRFRVLARFDEGDELAGIVEDAFCTIAPKSLLAQAGLLEAED